MSFSIRILIKNNNLRYFNRNFTQNSRILNYFPESKKPTTIKNNDLNLFKLKSIRFNSTDIIQPTEDVGLFKKVLKKVGFTPNIKSRLKVSSYILYETVADKINYLEFFNEFNLPNTFNSWFLVTELHVWMLLLRAMGEGSESGEDGRFLRNNIVEAMWADVNTRAKQLGAHNPSGTRAQIGILSEQFQAALIAYDEGIMSEDKILANALWRRFFDQNCDDYLLLERLVLYVRTQVKMLDKLSRDELIMKPKPQWIPLKNIQIEI